ncbi:MAG TPA: pitrilysin family protein, partial [Thermoanaerobaculia bacterium]|nr:pitrilysin family protein [Thermoanaerobaculia bacterium]
MRKVLAMITAAAALAAGTAAATPSLSTIPDIPYEKFTLPNGLTVLVHEDPKAPIVAVNIWYHVGSKNEKTGKTGFAHLFEHLMFNGSENFNDDYFKAMEKVGATDLNGTTNVDRTNYFQNVPKSALDFALFLESDRMGHLIGAIDQAKLDEQRGVVQNEKRQGENQPYGRVWDLITEQTYPAGHPYSWSVIGSMEDLDAASLEDVHDWFRSYYGPNNAVLSIAGDVTVAEAREKVERWFGSIPPGPPIARHETWVAKMTGEKRGRYEDRVPQPRLHMVWNVPPTGSPELDLLGLAAAVLAEGKSSRFYKRLVYDDQIATDVAAFAFGKEIGGQMIIMATARPGGDLAAVEKALREELARFLAGGPTAAELERAKTSAYARRVRGLERIGGFGGKSDVLASGYVYTGDPHAYKKSLATQLAATPAAVRETAAAWLSDGLYLLEVHPFPELAATGTDPDRSRFPETGTPPAPGFPKIEHATLANGLKLVVAERHGVPVVEASLLVDAGYAADAGGILGTAALTQAMLDEGTRRHDALAISDELDRLGASLGAGASLDSSFVSLSALRETLDASLALFAEVVLEPTFPEANFERLRRQQLAAIQREKVNPSLMGLRVLPALLYGAGHAYAVPFTGSGTEASVAALDRNALAAHHATWYKPNNATLVVVGDTTLAEIQPKIEKLFGGWKAGEVPAKNVAPATTGTRAEVYLIDRPGSQQSVIFAGVLAPPKNSPEDTALQAFNYALGGTFTSRLNMNLREDKHWSYGARMTMPDARGPRPYFVMAPVQGDKTKEAVAEVVRELTEIVGARP